MAPPALALLFLLPAAASARRAEPIGTPLDVGSVAPEEPSEVLDWDATVEAKVDREIAEVKEAERAQSLLQQGNKSYGYTQLVGLSIFTLPHGIRSMKYYYPGIRKELEKGVREEDHNLEDASERVRIMAKMLEVAYKSEGIANGSDVLKIFVAPEFFFRGPRGAYDMRSLDGCLPPKTPGVRPVCNAAIVQILQELQSLVIDDRWTDWLFVFGTIVASEGQDFYNFAPVMRGGRGAASGHHVVAKKHVSRLDFLKNQTGCLGPDCVLYKGFDDRYAAFSERQVERLAEMGFTFSAGSDFYIGGQHIGLEICLDHWYEEAKQQLKRNDKDNLDVHIVTSAGMEIMYLASKLHGPVYMQDGSFKARSSYKCRFCTYINEGEEEGEGYGKGFTRETGLLPAGRLKFMEKDLNITKGEEVFTKRKTHTFYSVRGFATEGTGGELDGRFTEELIGKVFSTEDVMPTINMGPAFAVPASYPPDAAEGQQRR